MRKYVYASVYYIHIMDGCMQDACIYVYVRVYWCMIVRKQERMNA